MPGRNQMLNKCFPRSSAITAFKAAIELGAEDLGRWRSSPLILDCITSENDPGLDLPVRWVVFISLYTDYHHEGSEMQSLIGKFPDHVGLT